MTPPAHGFRTFVVVWATQSLSVLGTTVIQFAVSIWLAQVLYPRPAQKPELAFALSAVMVAAMLPLILAPIAGAWADRHDRRLTMATMDLASAALDGFIVLLLLASHLHLWLLVGLVLVYATLGIFHQQSFMACYVMLVPERQLPRANGMMETMFSISGIVAPALAAFLIALPALTGHQLPHPGNAGLTVALVVDALTFVLAGLTLLGVAIPSPRRGEHDRGSIWQDAGFGATYIWRRRPLLWLLGTFTVANFVGGFENVFLPLLVKFNLAADWRQHGFTFKAAYALVATVGSIGGVAGGFLISAWGGLQRRRVLGVLVPMIVAAAAEVVFGLSHLLYLTAGMLGIMFGMTPFLNAHSQTIWQTQVPPEMQGRVFAMRRLIAQVSAPVSAAVAGWAGAAFDPGLVLAILGGAYGLFCVVQLFNRTLMRVEDREWLEGLAAGGPAPSTGPAG